MRHGCRLHALARRSVTPSSFPAWRLGATVQRKLERLDGVVVGDDVVTVLEHLQQVACERDVPGQALGDERVDAHQANRDVEARAPADSERRPELLPELVPADDVGAAELEGPVRFGFVEGGGEVRGHVVDPDRLDPLVACADDRRHRGQLRELAEGRQDAAVSPEDEARPEDHVLETGVLDRLLHLPLAVVVGDEVLRVLACAEGAHQDEALDAGVLCGRDEVAGSLLHHPLELLLSALADRDEVDDRIDAFDRVLEADGVRHLADDRLAR